jgi:Poly-beta-hydroxybutyrate polymerase (PhaC) N-terminus
LIAPFETRQRWRKKVRGLRGSYRTSPTGNRPGRRRETTSASNDPAWTENTFYKSLLQGYMAWSQSLQNFAEKAGFESKEIGRATFLLTQIREALAPTNFLFSNPAAVKAAIDSGGKTLLDGY